MTSDSISIKLISSDQERHNRCLLSRFNSRHFEQSANNNTDKTDSDTESTNTFTAETVIVVKREVNEEVIDIKEEVVD